MRAAQPPAKKTYCGGIIMKFESKKAFVECRTDIVAVETVDIIRTSGGIDVGREVDGNPFVDWNEEAQG